MAAVADEAEVAAAAHPDEELSAHKRALVPRRQPGMTVKLSLDEKEIEFCTQCFLRREPLPIEGVEVGEKDCTYCYNKYLYKAAKRTKPGNT